MQLSRWEWLTFGCMRKSGASHKTWQQSRVPSWDCHHNHSPQKGNGDYLILLTEVDIVFSIMLSVADGLDNNLQLNLVL